MEKFTNTGHFKKPCVYGLFLEMKKFTKRQNVHNFGLTNFADTYPPPKINVRTQRYLSTDLYTLPTGFVDK